MSYLTYKFCIKCFDGKECYMDEVEIYNRLKARDLFASVTEIIKVCNEPKFSDGLAIAIRMQILELHTEMILSNPDFSVDFEGVWECYNSLDGRYNIELMRAIGQVRENFLTVYLKSIICSKLGTELSEKDDKWIAKEATKYAHRKRVDFYQLAKSICDRFNI